MSPIQLILLYMPLIEFFWSDLTFNRPNSVERGLASTPLLIIPGFSLHFPLKLSYGYLRFEENEKNPSKK